MVVLITVCDILSRIEVKSRNHFCCCILIVDLSGGVFSNINAIAEKYIYWATILSETIRFYYRAMHFSAKRGIAIACRLSVCLSVCL